MRPTYFTWQSRLAVLANVLVFVLIGSALLYRFVIAPARRQNLQGGVARYTQECNLSALRGVLEQGANPNSRDPMNWPVIVMAANNGNPGPVKMLLDFHADPNLPNPSGETALMQAARNVPLHKPGGGGSYLDANGIHDANGYEEAGLLLIRRGASVNSAAPGVEGPLFYAISGGSIPLVKAMLEHGANPNFQSSQKGVPLELCVGIQRNDLIPLLIAHGADPNRPDKTGTSPLLYAAEFNKPISFHAMLAHGGNIRWKTADGSTILMGACAGGNRELVQLALRSGIDVNIRDKDGDTAITCATKGKHPELIPLLKQAGATR